MSKITTSTSLRLNLHKNWKSDWIINKNNYSKFFLFDKTIRTYINKICTTKKSHCQKIIFKKKNNQIYIYVYIFDYFWRQKKKHRKELKYFKYLNKNKKKLYLKKKNKIFKKKKIKKKINDLNINIVKLNNYINLYLKKINLPLTANIFFIKHNFRNYKMHRVFYEVLKYLKKKKIFSPFLNILTTVIYTQNAELLNLFLIKNLMKNLRHKQFFKKINFILQKLLQTYSNFKGFKIQFKGKINGASRARKLSIQGGVIPKTTLKYPIKYDFKPLTTSAGVCSFKTWLFFNKLNK